MATNKNNTKEKIEKLFDGAESYANLNRRTTTPRKFYKGKSKNQVISIEPRRIVTGHLLS